MDAELVGRRRELSAVAAAFADAADGRPRVVSIEGDGGAGKTALARRSLADLDVAHRAVVLTGDELTAAVPFGALGPLVDVPSGTTAVEAARLVIGRLAELADAGLLVVLVDDLHWVDPASRRALAIAARRLEHETVAIVATARPEHGGADDGWARLRDDAGRCVRCRVGGLTAADVAALAARRGTPLTSVAARRLTEHTGGNALYVTTLLADVPAEALNRPGEELPVPAGLSAVVAARFAGLDAAPAALLGALAVLARPAPLPQVAEVADRADPAAAVDRLLATRWVDWLPGGTGPVRLAFVHPLIRQAVYDTLPLDVRRRLHLAAARVSDRRGELAHRVAAADRVDEALAAELEAEAGSASAPADAGAAARMLRWAADLTPERAARERRLLAAARLAADAADPALDDLVPAVAACADGPARDLVLGTAAWRAGDSGEAIDRLRRAATGADVAVEALVRLADAFVVLGHGQAAVDAASDALDRGPSDERTRLRAWASRALGVASRDGAVAGLEVLRDLLPSRPDECAPAESGLLALRGLLGWFALRPTAALDDLAAVLARPATTLERRGRAQLDVAQCQYVLGRWDEATVHARLVLELSDGERDAGVAHQVLAGIAAGRGDWHAAAVHLAAARRLAATFGTPELALAARLAAFAVARARGAHAEIAALVSTADAVAPPVLSTLSVYHPGASAHIEAGDLDVAVRLADRLAAAAERRRVDVSAQVADLRGRAAARRGDPAAADRHLAAAADAITADTPVLIAAGIHLARGRLLRARGRRHDAITALAEARTIYENLGARPYLDRVDAELTDAGLSRPSRRRSPLDLTPREQDVVTLAVRGRSNKEIAAELFVSEKAVEYHLRNTYAKLGITSKRDLPTHL
ncbi:helix-turn-helix transcriptional regulator [Actinomadura chibensis]|uniref:AAA family ATPase n=1 Tax=Actinomadura chibensis TaxID=392828 RepID=A0A5D0NW83_9ACTN|nr:LuxR family transcriptional regulator [Actinomadura chibensis]TYB48943.1 AAA family ATPase [Actinomadura chibensis]